MARRTGLRTVRALAVKTCRLLTKYGPVITALYGDKPALVAAIAAAKAACEELVTQLDIELPQGV